MQVCQIVVLGKRREPLPCRAIRDLQPALETIDQLRHPLTHSRPEQLPNQYRPQVFPLMMLGLEPRFVGRMRGAHPFTFGDQIGQFLGLRLELTGPLRQFVRTWREFVGIDTQDCAQPSQLVAQSFLAGDGGGVGLGQLSLLCVEVPVIDPAVRLSRVIGARYGTSRRRFDKIAGSSRGFADVVDGAFGVVDDGEHEEAGGEFAAFEYLLGATVDQRVTPFDHARLRTVVKQQQRVPSARHTAGMPTLGHHVGGRAGAQIVEQFRDLIPGEELVPVVAAQGGKQLFRDRPAEVGVRDRWCVSESLRGVGVLLL
ncbi:hypothetical protein IU486_32295 [Streptomyces gardneri]|nr:hypothetical protein [Streptomyces gardneri]